MSFVFMCGKEWRNLTYAEVKKFIYTNIIVSLKILKFTDETNKLQ